ncbi:MAG: alpha/beta hydrolase [Betaproteobacteria bacterium]|nr:MAG: alpha/beta hydrolase [Betaproteobacteria bacterium]
MPFVAAAGRSLEYEWLAGREPTLVFLHEGLGSIRQWRDFPARVAQATGCRALLYNRYGYGQSDVLAEPRVGVRFMHDEALVALPQLLAALQIDAPVLVGHSDGASIALIFAGSGHRLRGLALMAPHVFVEDLCIESITRAKRTFETSDIRKRLGKYHRDAARTFYLWNDVWLDPEFRHWNIEQYLPGIRAPVLAIQGEDDEYGTLRQLEAIARQVAGPCEPLALPRCGHSPHRDQPEAVLAAVTRFIGTLA